MDLPVVDDYAYLPAAFYAGFYPSLDLEVDAYAPIPTFRGGTPYELELLGRNGPTYSVTTERLYRRLPEKYRVLDRRNDWHFKKYLSTIADQLNEVDVLVARLGFVPPEKRAEYLGTLDQYNTYVRPNGVTEPAIGDTSDLLDGRTADTRWLPWIAQILGAQTTGITDEAELRDAVINNFLGYQVGSRRAIEAATRSLLTGTKTVTIRKHDNGGSGTPLGPEWFSDPLFDDGVGPFYDFGVGTLTLDTGSPYPGGTQSIKLRRSSSETPDTMALGFGLNGLVVGADYRFSAWVATTDSPNYPTMYAEVDGVPSASHSVTPEDGWYRIDVDFTASEADTAGQIRDATGTANTGFYLGRVSLRQYMTGVLGTMWDVTIVTLAEETPLTSEEMVAAIVAKGAKPAGIVLHHVLADDVSDGPLDKPTITHTGLGKFTITNYNPSYTYNLSAGTRSGNVITLTNTNQSATVYVTDGPDASPSTYIERKAYTFTVGDVIESYEVPVGAGCPPGYNYEPYGGWAAYCRRYNTKKNATPVGYTDQYGEWFRII